MNKYTKILPFDTGSERPTTEYAEYLETINAELLGALERLVCVVDQAAFIDTGGVVHKATKAIRKAKENTR